MERYRFGRVGPGSTSHTSYQNNIDKGLPYPRRRTNFEKENMTASNVTHLAKSYFLPKEVLIPSPNKGERIIFNKKDVFKKDEKRPYPGVGGLRFDSHLYTLGMQTGLQAAFIGSELVKDVSRTFKRILVKKIRSVINMENCMPLKTSNRCLFNVGSPSPRENGPNFSSRLVTSAKSNCYRPDVNLNRSDIDSIWVSCL